MKNRGISSEIAAATSAQKERRDAPRSALHTHVRMHARGILLEPHELNGLRAEIRPLNDSRFT